MATPIELDEYETRVATAILEKFTKTERYYAGLTAVSIAKELSNYRNEHGEYVPYLYPSIQEGISDFWENDRSVEEAVAELYPPYREQVNGTLSVM